MEISSVLQDKETHLGAVMSFHDVSYTVKMKKKFCGSFRDVITKEVLCDVSGIIKPGLNAIMGPTGGGKTTLLDVLAGRKDPSCVSGRVSLNGEDLPRNFRYLRGYVMQNDLLVGMVTVRESLWFCANLRLPTSISHNEKRERIVRILTELGLNSCADTKIGTEMIRGISGGEKKRTSIALELILEPKILFLDEPTTGLDAATAKSVMMLLRNLGDKGCTIVCSIHQPRYSIFKLFDFLTLLSAGNLIYHGGSSKALEYFENLGYGCEPHENPADFFLDVLNGEYEIESLDIGVKTPKHDGIPSTFIKRIRDSYLESKSHQFLQQELSKIAEYVPTSSDSSKISEPMYATSFFHQLKIILRRTARNTVRNHKPLVATVITNVLTGLVFGLIYFQVDNMPGTAFQNRFGLLFSICAILLFGCLPVIDTFAKNMEIYNHEYQAGYYRVISYYTATVFADMIPLRTISPLIFCSITYWMAGLDIDPERYFTFLLTVILIGYASLGIGLLYSASFGTSITHPLMSITFTFSILFSGLLVNIDTLMPWLSWIKYLSIARYGMVGLSINELRGQEFSFCINESNFQPPYVLPISNDIQELNTYSNCTVVLGEKYLFDKLTVGESEDYISEWDLWQNNVALFVMITVLYTLAYAQLARAKIYA